MSEKARGAVPFACSGFNASLATPPSLLWRQGIEQGLHDGFACGRKLKVHFLHDGRSGWSCGTWWYGLKGLERSSLSKFKALEPWWWLAGVLQHFF